MPTEWNLQARKNFRLPEGNTQEGAKPLTCAPLQISSERDLDYAVPSEATQSALARHLRLQSAFLLLLQNDVTIQADGYTDASAGCRRLLNPHDGSLAHDNATVGPLGKSQHKIDAMSPIAPLIVKANT